MNVTEILKAAAVRLLDSEAGNGVVPLKLDEPRVEWIGEPLGAF